MRDGSGKDNERDLAMQEMADRRNIDLHEDAYRNLILGTEMLLKGDDINANYEAIFACVFSRGEITLLKQLHKQKYGALKTPVSFVRKEQSKRSIQYCDKELKSFLEQFSYKEVMGHVLGTLKERIAEAVRHLLDYKYTTTIHTLSSPAKKKKAQEDLESITGLRAHISISFSGLEELGLDPYAFQPALEEIDNLLAQYLEEAKNIP